MSTDRPFFATPQDAEAAFYDALERADLEAMMAVWSEDEEIVCIHPGGPRLAGYAAVRESWRMIFRNGSRLRVATSGLQATQGMLLAVHNLHEQLSLVGEGEATQTVLATNVYQRGADGWRMVLHHTAPAPDAADPPIRYPTFPPRCIDSSYRAPPWLRGGHLQTLWPLMVKGPLPAYRRERWDTPTATSSMWIGSGRPARGAAHHLCSTAWKAAPAATTPARSCASGGARLARRGGAFPRLLRRAQQHPAPTTPATAPRSTGCCSGLRQRHGGAPRYAAGVSLGGQRPVALARRTGEVRGRDRRGGLRVRAPGPAPERARPGTRLLAPVHATLPRLLKPRAFH